MQSPNKEAQKYSIWPQLYAAFSASLGMLSLGTILGWMSPAMRYLSNPDFGYDMDYDQMAWVASVIYLGMIGGPVVTLLLVDKIGRKKTQLCAPIFYTIGWVIVLLTNSYVQLMIARFLMGFGGGITVSCCPLYVAEVSENKRRGTFLSLSASLVATGLLFSSIVGSRATFQWLNISAALIPLLFVAMFAFAPESPHFFEKNGRRSDALKSLMWLRGVKTEEAVAEEIDSISQFVKRNITLGLVDTSKEMSKKGNLKTLTLVLMIFFGQQISGNFAISSYTEKIFRDIGSAVNPPDAVILLSAFTLLFFWISSAIVDRGGRKLLFLSSCAGTCAANLLIGTYLLLSQYEVIDTSLSWVAVVGLFGFSAAVAIGLSPIPNIILGEIFPSSIRSWSICFVCVFQIGLAFAVTKLFQVIDSTIGSFFAFYLFAFSVFVVFVYVCFLMPETKKMSFNEIQETLEESINK